MTLIVRHPLAPEDLSRYVDGELSAWRRRRVRRHLRDCEPCRRYVEQIEGLAHGLRTAEPAGLSESAEAGLHRAYAAWLAARD